MVALHYAEPTVPHNELNPTTINQRLPVVTDFPAVQDVENLQVQLLLVVGGLPVAQDNMVFENMVACPFTVCDKEMTADCFATEYDYIATSVYRQ